MKALYVATNSKTNDQIALLREMGDFSLFENPKHIKSKYINQNNVFINPRIQGDILKGIPIKLIQVMVCNNQRQIGVAKKMKQAYNKLFKLQEKYYSTI